ncbi:hypothetical protein PN462_08075 [Spirulina sp. CS-785/01]|uniref:hypothetical protein n=1 Tax=Spirulina sp. CS-785/01 TaxID=3021716 RepID=UPI00232E5167|nr:hypothetical protein [Spirulina sp. CS-785/01]MDB9313056.1 hypothetical protein [Spirulina sp. CS-785/01]
MRKTPNEMSREERVQSGYTGNLHRVRTSSHPRTSPNRVSRDAREGERLTQTHSRYPPIPPSSDPNPSPKRPWYWRWQFWAALIVLFSGTSGLIATALLLKLPAVPNCPTTHWPTASASMRLYCAQLAANKQTQGNLLQAIQLVQDLPEDHPLQAEVARYLEAWVSDLLALGEEKFQNGEIKEAIALAEEISDRFEKENNVIAQQITEWRNIWARGEEIEAQIATHMKKGDWGAAFQASARLTQLENRYWSTTRYDQIHQRLTLARQESRKLDEAYAQLEKGNIDDILQGIELAEQIAPESNAYPEAQDLIQKAGDRMVTMALREMEQGAWQEAIYIANQIPNSLGHTEKVKDINQLANAVSTASSGSQINLEDAIAMARNLDPSRPLYHNAQKLIVRWQSELQGAARLARAARYAREGTIQGLNAAIAQAKMVSSSNPRYPQAREQIQDWTRQLQTLEDRPYLERATRLARNGDVSGYQQAVRQANQIDPNRPLYQEAQRRIQQWEGNIQENQDQPRLDRAIALANNGNYQEALAEAGQIDSNSPVYRQAQNRMSQWQAELDARQALTQAYQTADSGNPQALRSAIISARQIADNTQIVPQRDEAIRQWSYQILQQAQGRAQFSIREAITIAQAIPPNTPAYNAAQQQITAWEKMLPVAPNESQTSFPEQF